MASADWKVLVEVSGGLRPEILKGLLEAQGIPAMLNQEGAGRAYGLTVGPLGQVQVLVPAEQYEEARQLLDDFYAGKFAAGEGEEPRESEED